MMENDVTESTPLLLRNDDQEQVTTHWTRYKKYLIGYIMAIVTVLGSVESLTSLQMI